MGTIKYGTAEITVHKGDLVCVYSELYDNYEGSATTVSSFTLRCY
jgi:hypothetical protein